MDYLNYYYDEAETRKVSRRKFIKLGLAAAVSAIISGRTVNAAASRLSNKRSLAIYNVNTKEYFNYPFWINGKYDHRALQTIDYLFRDGHNEAVKPIDTRLIELLYAIQKKLRNREPFYLVSGYRSPPTNAWLRKHNIPAAKRSYHMYGMAADVHIPGQSLEKLRRVAYQLKAGGVGYYPNSKYIHLDVGRVRFW